MIKTAIRFQNDMVMVFDQYGEQIPAYQGKYQDVKEKVLKDAPQEAIFAHGFSAQGELNRVSQEEW